MGWAGIGGRSSSSGMGRELGAVPLLVRDVVLALRGTRSSLLLSLLFVSNEANLASHGWRAISSGQLIGHQAIVLQVVVVGCAIHLGILGNALLACLSRDQRSSHGAGNDTRSNDENGGCKNNPAAPLHVWNKQKNVNQEGQKRDQKSWECEDQQGQEVARRMGGRVKVSGDGQGKADEGQESCYGVDDKDGRERGAGAGG
jgi:hypothetical protein